MLDRRTLLQSSAILGGLALSQTIQAKDLYPEDVVKAHDQTVAELLSKQITDPANRWLGGYANQYGLVNPHSAAHILKKFVTAYVCRQSKYFETPVIKERIQLAVNHLLHAQNDQGNIDLLTTNFNSPPDTGFVVHNVATAARLAYIEEETEILDWIKPFLLNAGKALSVGGIHTPNHRWVVCAALAQIHELFPNQAYIDRIDEWLAEGIDIDDDGMYTERSTTVYNAVTNNALVTVAHKLERFELLDPVVKNLQAMRFLVHPNGDVVTAISRRQDLNTRGDLRRYWFGLRYMALRQLDGGFSWMLDTIEPHAVDLSALMEYPELNQPLPKAVSFKTYDQEFKEAGITRRLKDNISSTVVHTGNSRFFSFHYGEAVVNAVRFATAFFGKGQFVPDTYEQLEDGFYFKQSLTGPYYQPLDPPRKIEASGIAWSAARQEREQSEVCHMHYEVWLLYLTDGFEIKIQAEGTDNVPVAVEINLRDGGELSGVKPVEHTPNAWVLPGGMAEYKMGNDVIRFGPGIAENTYVQVRGADDKLPGPSVYLTSYTPFKHQLKFTVN